MAKPKTTFKILLKQRLYFLLEVLIIFLGIFFAMLIPVYVVPWLIPLSSLFFEPVFYTIRAVVAILAIILFLYFSNFILESQKRKLILEEDENPATNYINLFKITKKNFKYQLLYGVLLLFLVFIPLDFFTYLLLPEMLAYSADALNVYSSASLNSYFLESYGIFIISVLIIQVFVSFYEEALTRGFLTTRAVEYTNKMSAVIISSFFFGLGHYRYLFTESTIGFSPIYPFIWFIQTFLVGIILSLLVLRRHWLFPVIFAHACNNILSAHSIWNYLQGNSFQIMVFAVYIPLLIGSILFFFWQFSRIKEGLKIGFKELATYFKNDSDVSETGSVKILRIILDFLFAIIIFLVGVIII